jgi:hypothetical protein
VIVVVICKQITKVGVKIGCALLSHAVHCSENSGCVRDDGHLTMLPPTQSRKEEEGVTKDTIFEGPEDALYRGQLATAQRGNK